MNKTAFDGQTSKIDELFAHLPLLYVHENKT